MQRPGNVIRSRSEPGVGSRFVICLAPKRRVQPDKANVRPRSARGTNSAGLLWRCSITGNPDHCLSGGVSYQRPIGPFRNNGGRAFVKFVRDKTLAGDRRIRASLSGETTIRYQATVENSVRQLLPPAGRQYLCSELAADVLPFLLPSRFCRSDKFMPFAQREFGDSGDGVARIMSMSPTRHERN